MRQHSFHSHGMLAFFLIATLAYQPQAVFALTQEIAEQFQITPLHEAAGNGDEVAARALVQSGADVNAKEALVCLSAYVAGCILDQLVIRRHIFVGRT